MKGLFIPEITAEMFRNGCLESIEALMAKGEIYDIEHYPKAENEKEDVLDKIRAEIEQITDTMGVSYNQYVSKIDVLQILDKYKAESEEEDE